MIERGFESPIWMAQAIISNANPMMLKVAVIELIDKMSSIEDANRMDAFEAIDMLVQISTTGKYFPPAIEEDVLYSQRISQEELDEILQVLREAPEANDVPDSFEDFMRGFHGGDDDDTED